MNGRLWKPAMDVVDDEKALAGYNPPVSKRRSMTMATSARKITSGEGGDGGTMGTSRPRSVVQRAG
jgi:hypothetical protein